MIRPTTSAAISRWVYAVQHFDRSADPMEGLNRYGAAGWELVTVVMNPDGGLAAYFKRSSTA